MHGVSTAREAYTIGGKFHQDPAKVTAAVDRLVAHAPSLKNRSPGSADGGARGTAAPSASTWADLLKK
jgi:hypothetical protein